MGSRSERVLDDWAAGFTAKQIAQRCSTSLNTVKADIRDARKAGDARAFRRYAPADPSRCPAPSDDARAGFQQIRDDGEDQAIATAQRDRDAAALATLIKVHGHPSKVTTLAPASGAFRRRDVHPSAMALVQPSRDFGDPPAGRSALDQRRAG